MSPVVVKIRDTSWIEKTLVVNSLLVLAITITEDGVVVSSLKTRSNHMLKCFFLDLLDLFWWLRD